MVQYSYEKVDGEFFGEINADWIKKVQNTKFDLYLKKSGIPKNYWDLDFNNYEGQKSLESKKYETNLVQLQQ